MTTCSKSAKTLMVWHKEIVNPKDIGQLKGAQHMSNDTPTVAREQKTAEMSKTDFKSAREIIEDSAEAIQKLAPVYKEVGWAGFFAVSSVVIAMLTIALSFLTGTGQEGRWYGGITVWEEALFLSLCAVFAFAGLVFLIKYNDRKADIQQLTIEIERERNRWLHEETMAKLKLQGSQPAADADGLSAQTGNANNMVIG
jgi:hypothetical protein